MDSDIHFIESGDGIPLIFQHGLGANVQQVEALFEGLDGFRLVSMDCPGHGHSPLPTGVRPSFDYYTEQVLKLIDLLRIGQAYFGGISMGSGIALNMALRFPERVKGLLLVRPAWLNDGSPANLAILLEAAHYLRTTGSAAFRKEPGYSKIEDEVPHAAQSLMGLFDSSQRPELPDVLEAMVSDHPFHDLLELQRVEVPSVVIGNGDDPLHPGSMASTIYKSLQHSEFHTIISRYIDAKKHRLELQAILKDFIDTHEKPLER